MTTNLDKKHSPSRLILWQMVWSTIAYRLTECQLLTVEIHALEVHYSFNASCDINNHSYNYSMQHQLKFIALKCKSLSYRLY